MAVAGGREDLTSLLERKRLISVWLGVSLSPVEQGGTVVLVLLRMGMGASRLCVTLLDIKHTTYKGFRIPLTKLTPRPLTKGRLGDDQYAAKLYVPARFNIAGRAYERPLFFFSAAIAV